MKHDHNCLWTVFTSLIFRKGSKTENMKAKDPIWICFIYLKIMKMEPKRLQDVNGASVVFFLSVLQVRD